MTEYNCPFCGNEMVVDSVISGIDDEIHSCCASMNNGVSLVGYHITTVVTYRCHKCDSECMNKTHETKMFE